MWIIPNRMLIAKNQLSLLSSSCLAYVMGPSFEFPYGLSVARLLQCSIYHLGNHVQSWKYMSLDGFPSSLLCEVSSLSVFMWSNNLKYKGYEVWATCGSTICRWIYLCHWQIRAHNLLSTNGQLRGHIMFFNGCLWLIGTLLEMFQPQCQIH